MSWLRGVWVPKAPTVSLSELLPVETIGKVQWLLWT